MILVLQKEASQECVAGILARLTELKLSGQVMHTAAGTVVGILEDCSHIPSRQLSKIPGVIKLFGMQEQAGIATTALIPPLELNNGLKIGAGLPPVIMAGPCSVESQTHILEAASRVRDAGAKILRGGAFKPRTSPYDFQGLGLDGLKYLDEARKASGLPVISEVMTPEHVAPAEPLIDILQVGARNMYNYELLKELGKSKHPVLLKRGLSATISEWLSAAEYIMSAGNMQVILCERGIRSFETETRNTLDLSAVAVLKRSCSLPVVVDPSHGTGRRDLIRVMSRAAIACGADGLLIEVHDAPQQALSDGHQAISTEKLRDIVQDSQQIFSLLNPLACSAAGAANRDFGGEPRTAAKDLLINRAL